MLVGLFDFRTECWKNVFAAADGRKFKVEIAEVTVTLQKVTDTHRNLSPSEPGRNIPGLSTYGSMIHGFSLLLSMASSLLCKNTDFMYKVYSLGQKINLLQKDSAKVVDEAIPLASSQEDNGQENGAGAGDVGGVLAGDDLQRPPDACDRVAKELNALSAITRTQEELAYAISQSIPVIKEEDADFGMGQVEHTVEAESDELFSQLLTNTAEDMDVDDPVGHSSRNLDGLRKRASEADGQPNSDDGCRLEGNEIGESPFSVHYAACPSGDAENERVDGDLVPDSVPAGEESQAGDGEAPLLEVQMDRDQLGAALVQQERLTKKYFDDAKSVRNVRIKTHGFVNIDRIEFDIKTELFHDYQSLSQWSSAIYEDAFDLSKMDKDDLWLMNMLPFGEAARQECMDEWYVPRHEEDPVFQRNPEAHINEEIYVDEDATIYENSIDEENMDPNEHVALMEVPFKQSPKYADGPSQHPDEDRRAERAGWDEKIKKHGLFRDIAPIHTTSKIATSRAFLHVLARASQGIISLQQEYAYGEIQYCTLPNAAHKLAGLVDGSEPSCASQSVTTHTITPL